MVSLKNLAFILRESVLLEDFKCQSKADGKVWGIVNETQCAGGRGSHKERRRPWKPSTAFPMNGTRCRIWGEEMSKLSSPTEEAYFVLCSGDRPQPSAQTPEGVFHIQHCTQYVFIKRLLDDLWLRCLFSETGVLLYSVVFYQANRVQLIYLAIKSQWVNCQWMSNLRTEPKGVREWYKGHL